LNRRVPAPLHNQRPRAPRRRLPTLLLTAALAAVAAAPAAALTARGTPAADVLRGTASADELRGHAGDDVIRGGAEGDLLVGGSGRDVFGGGNGNDRIFARDSEVDRVTCGPGRDRVVADAQDRVAEDCEVVVRSRPRAARATPVSGPDHAPAVSTPAPPAPAAPAPPKETPPQPAPPAAAMPTEPAIDPEVALRAAYGAVMGQYLPDIDAFWARTFLDRGVAYTSPAIVGAYGEASSLTCAGESAGLGNAFYCTPADFIAWDENGLMWPVYRNTGPGAVAFVLAHEWGHAIQSRLGETFAARVDRELHADCLSGAWAGDARARGVLDDAAVDQAGRTAHGAGSPDGTPEPPDDPHGSATQRLTAFQAGLGGGSAACATYALPPPAADPPAAV
jgi:predicted metalloprotease